VNTVRAHVRAIAKKLNASGQADILRRAWQLRLFEE
jgi:DNA-binding CsgD family transcriptional regulator